MYIIIFFIYNMTIQNRREEKLKVLSGKWWWKFSTYFSPCWSNVISFNYVSNGGQIPLFHTTPRISSFFWKSLLKCRAAFLSSMDVSIKDGKDTSFWLDCQFENSTLRCILPVLFTRWRDPLNSLADFLLLELDPNFVSLFPLRSSLIQDVIHGRDSKIWRWNNKGFTVKSFYFFLDDGGTCYCIGKALWRGPPSA